MIELDGPQIGQNESVWYFGGFWTIPELAKPSKMAQRTMKKMVEIALESLYLGVGIWWGRSLR